MGLDSRASSKPPSSDDAKARAERRKTPRSGRQRGAQPGHRGQARVGVEEVDHTEPYYPESQCACGGVVEIAPEPVLHHQVFDLPEVRYTVTEYQQYAGHCTGCGQRPVGVLPEWLEPLYAQIGAAVRQSAVAHADETTHDHRTITATPTNGVWCA